MILRSACAALAALVLFPIAGCTQTETDEAGNTVSGEGTIAMLQGQDGLSAMASAFETTGLAGIFDGPAAYTVLAPDNAAFELVDTANPDLSNDERKPLLAAILRDHILPGAVTPEDIAASLEDGGSTQMTTMGNTDVTFTRNGDTVIVTGAEGRKAVIAGEAIRTDNGVVIPVDSLLRSTAPQED